MFTVTKNGYQVGEAEYRAMREGSEGFCLSCEHGAAECEPDTRERKCDYCESLSVYGAEELVIVGKLDVVPDCEPAKATRGASDASQGAFIREQCERVQRAGKPPARHCWASGFDAPYAARVYRRLGPWVVAQTCGQRYRITHEPSGLGAGQAGRAGECWRVLQVDRAELDAKLDAMLRSQ